MPKALKIKELIDKKGLVLKQIEKDLGYSNSGLRKAIENNSDLKTEIIEKLFSLYPDISEDWFYKDTGDMFIQKNYNNAGSGEQSTAEEPKTDYGQEKINNGNTSSPQSDETTDYKSMNDKERILRIAERLSIAAVTDSITRQELAKTINWLRDMVDEEREMHVKRTEA